MRKAAAKGSALALGRMDEYLGFRLRRIQNRLSKDFTAASAEYNLRHGLLSSLALIVANPGTSQAAISKDVGLDKSAIVSIVDDLEQRGLAERRVSKSDRRRHALYATPKGEAFLETLFGVLDETERHVANQLTRAELALLHEFLDRIYLACID